MKNSSRRVLIDFWVYGLDHVEVMHRIDRDNSRNSHCSDSKIRFDISFRLQRMELESNQVSSELYDSTAVIRMSTQSMRISWSTVSNTKQRSSITRGTDRNVYDVDQSDSVIADDRKSVILTVSGLTNRKKMSADRMVVGTVFC